MNLTRRPLQQEEDCKQQRSTFLANQDYINALGNFVWQFALLEWEAIYVTVTLNNDDWTKIPLKKSSNAIRNVLTNSIQLRPEFADRLSSFAKHYRAAILERNGLLHVHPYTAVDGSQQLGGVDREDVKREWTLTRLRDETKKLCDWGREGNILVRELRQKS